MEIIFPEFCAGETRFLLLGLHLPTSGFQTKILGSCFFSFTASGRYGKIKQSAASGRWGFAHGLRTVELGKKNDEQTTGNGRVGGGKKTAVYQAEKACADFGDAFARPYHYCRLDAGDCDRRAAVWLRQTVGIRRKRRRFRFWKRRPRRRSLRRRRSMCRLKSSACRKRLPKEI